jgi:hypothetical protein
MVMEEIYSREYFEIEEMGCGVFVKCKSCGWFPEQEHSHVIYGNTNCQFINKPSNQIRPFEYIAELRGQDSSGNWHSIRITEASVHDIWNNRALIHEAGQFILNESFTYDRIRLNVNSPSSGISSPVSILKDGKQVLYEQWMAEDILKRKSNT